MLKSGALYYAVFLSFLIALTAGFFILYTYFYNFFIDQQLLRGQVIANVNSAINVFCKDPNAFNYNTATPWRIEGEPENQNINVTRKHWGAYDLIFAKAQNKHYSFQKMAITGDDFFQKDQYALYLADKKKYLSISGSTKLVGNCYLPKLGIKRAYIEGQGYKNKELVYGEIKISSSKLPARNYLLDKWLEPYLSKNYPKTDSILFLSEIRNIKEINNSFQNKTLLLLTDIQSGFPRIPVIGNVIIHSDATLLIPGNAIAKNVIVFAPSIIIESGFSGCIQVFASQSIDIRDNCLLEYPSFVGLYCTKSDENAFVNIGNNTLISGGILLDASGNGKEDPKIKLDNKSTVEGIVYSSGAVQSKGKITGSLCAEKFFLKTASSIYENHLLNSTINRVTLNKEFAGPIIIDDMVNQKIIKWIN